MHVATTNNTAHHLRAGPSSRIRLAVNLSAKLGLISTKVLVFKGRGKARNGTLGTTEAPSIEFTDEAAKYDTTEVFGQDLR